MFLNYLIWGIAGLFLTIIFSFVFPFLSGLLIFSIINILIGFILVKKYNIFIKLFFPGFFEGLFVALIIPIGTIGEYLSSRLMLNDLVNKFINLDNIFILWPIIIFCTIICFFIGGLFAKLYKKIK